MAISVLIHIANSDAVMAEVEELPDPADSFILCTNPRAKDGKPIHYFDPEASRFLIPWHRITYVEAYPTEDDQAEVEIFFRE
jgi:hypothetical protein